MRISDWSSDVCSSDLRSTPNAIGIYARVTVFDSPNIAAYRSGLSPTSSAPPCSTTGRLIIDGCATISAIAFARSEEHTSELQSLMRISYAVFCLKKKKKVTILKTTIPYEITKHMRNTTEKSINIQIQYRRRRNQDYAENE